MCHQLTWGLLQSDSLRPSLLGVLVQCKTADPSHSWDMERLELDDSGWTVCAV